MDCLHWNAVITKKYKTFLKACGGTKDSVCVGCRGEQPTKVSFASCYSGVVKTCFAEVGYTIWDVFQS